jgi:hypothetical protein
MERAAVAVAAALLATLLAGCMGNTPKGRAEEYISHLKAFDYHFCYQGLTLKDRTERAFGQFLTEIPLAPEVSPTWFKLVLRVTKYDVGEPRIEGTSAIVPIRVTTPDLPRWERTLDAAAGAEGVTEETAERSLGSGNYPTLSYTDSIVTVKERHRWRLFVDFPQKDRIADIHRNAIALYHRHEYENAVAAYQAMLDALDKEQATGNEGRKFLYGRELRDIRNVLAQLPESRAYIAKLKLSKVAMKMSDAHKPAIFGRVTNAGDRAIDEVEVTVTYYESSGGDLKAGYTDKHIAIATPLEFTEFSEPVLPFVPGETRDFGFLPTAPAEIQKNASPYVTVSSIAFTQSEAPLPEMPSSPAGSAKAPAASQPGTAAPGAVPSSPPANPASRGEAAGPAHRNLQP